MFASTPADHLPEYHALLRCLTPGPTLIADLPGDTPDEALKKRVIARDHKGALRSVKTSVAAAVLPNRWFWDNVRAAHGDGPSLVGGVSMPDAGGALLGAWYCRDSQKGGLARDMIKLTDIEDVLGGPVGEDEYVLWSVGMSGKPAMEIAKKGWTGHLDITLQKNGVEEIIVAKVHEHKGKKVAVLGMMDKFATLAGVTVSVEKGEWRDWFRRCLGDRDGIADQSRRVDDQYRVRDGETDCCRLAGDWCRAASRWPETGACRGGV